MLYLNFSFHRGYSESDFSIREASLQIDRSGWTSALFRLELLSHVYEFVGKGTVEPLVPVLEFEADMYKRMNTIQGKAIPVYLCSVDLTSAFHLTTRTAIVHLVYASLFGWRRGLAVRDRGGEAPARGDTIISRSCGPGCLARRPASPKHSLEHRA